MNIETIETNKYLFEIYELGGKWWVDKSSTDTTRKNTIRAWYGAHKSRAAIIRRINKLGR